MEEALLSISSLTLLLCLLSLLFLSIVFLFWYKIPWRRHVKIYRVLKSQGIDGPPPSFFSGNIEEMRSLTLKAKNSATTQLRCDDQSILIQDYAKSLFPYLHKWRKNYGQIFAFWIGRRPVICVTHPDLVKEISRQVSFDLGKATHFQKIQEPLFGRGVLKSNGAEWAHQRKIIAPEFFLDKVKGMVELMVESTVPLVNSWDAIIEHEGGTAEIVIDEYFRNFSGDVISRACFGGSYSKGKEIFAKLRALSRVISERRMHFDFPSWIKFFSTKGDQNIERLEKEIRTLILSVVRERMEKSTSEQDLLRSILANAGIGHVGSDAADKFIVDNCKNIYFAGHETTAVTATWCLVLLALHPQWQDRARAEVMEVCRGQSPNTDMIMKMKMLTWVIQETLRLFPPSALVVRETFQDMNFGKFYFPKGIELWVPTSTMHHDSTLWGADAQEFNPERFARGISGACKHPLAYIPFGFGARTCLGQNFALVELKVVLSILLSKFTFSPSPRYRHAPAFRLIIEPEFGVPLIVKKVSPDGFTCQERI